MGGTCFAEFQTRDGALVLSEHAGDETTILDSSITPGSGGPNVPVTLMTSVVEVRPRPLSTVGSTTSSTPSEYANASIQQVQQEP